VREVRLACATGIFIDVEAEVSPGGHRRYFIPRSSIDAYRARRRRAA
jgi:hypothetical protein